MTPDEHNSERMRAWIHVAAHTDTDNADYMLAAFDKRFPAPAAVEPVPAEPPMLFARTLAAMEERDAAAELAALREKARLWDAVASGKVRLVAAIDMRSVWWADYGTQPGKYTACTRNFHTAAEAVQAAIDAGALK